VLKRRHHDFLVILGLILVTFIAYSPALFQIPGADTVQYFYVTNYFHGYHSLIEHTYNLNRLVAAHSADALLFRPLLYITMATERFLFNYNFYLWQLINIILHIVISALLYFYLKTINPTSTSKPSAVILLLTFLFATCLSGCGLVMWAQVTGYMFCFIFILLGLLTFEKYLQQEKITSCLLALLFIAIASYYYEVGLVVAITIAARSLFNLLKSKKKKHYIPLTLFILLPAIYLSFTIAYIHQDASLKVLAHPHDDLLLQITTFITTSSFILFQWLTNTLTPFFLHLHAGGRVSASIPTIGCGIITISAALLFIALAIYKFRFKSCWSLFFWTGLILFGYLMLITLGRGLPRGAGYVLSNSPYYYYLTALLLTIMVYCLFTTPTEKPSKRFRTFFYGVLIAITLVNFIKLIEFNYHQYNHYSKARNHLYYTILNFIEAHSTQKVSFSIKGKCPGNYNLHWMTQWAKSLPSALLPNVPYQSENTTISDLFSTHYKVKNPDYFLICKGGKITFKPVK
jgi:hypothetical protein